MLAAVPAAAAVQRLVRPDHVVVVDVVVVVIVVAVGSAVFQEGEGCAEEVAVVAVGLLGVGEGGVEVVVGVAAEAHFVCFSYLMLR